uniref:G-protein coupled receptors family 1 profile domain-containing protein n=1 Tax=Lepeophtheirus salmonis TaxID=72036 RepID=A0A0K2UZB0_LEPSM
MFFYRPWVRTPSDDVIFNKQINNLGIYNFYRRSWGYGVLLGLTMIGSLILNSSFLMSFWTWPNQRKHAPSIVLLMFTIRDLFVTIFLIPTAIAWLVFGEGKWISGSEWCTISGFLDFFLAAEYPFLILCLCIVLITRKLTKYYDDFFDPALDEEDDHRKVDEYIQSIPTLSVPGVTVVGVGSPNGSRAPSVINQPIHGKYASSPPSIAYSDTSRGKRRLTPGGGFHHSNKAASISGGSVQRGANYLKPPLHNFRASSPLKEEIASVDLWEEASLGYPGRQCPSIRTREMVDMDDEDELGPPTFHQWHYFLTGTTWIIALSFGISAAFYMKYFQSRFDPIVQLVSLFITYICNFQISVHACYSQIPFQTLTS